MYEEYCADPPSWADGPTVYWAWLDEMDRLHRKAMKTPNEESAAWMAGIEVAARMENRAVGMQLVGIGALFAYRVRRHPEADEWAIDVMEAVAAEVAAGLRISQGSAMSKVSLARAMRERLPKTGALLCAGDIDVVALVIAEARTQLITDAAVMAEVDRRIAAGIPRWPSCTPSLSKKIDSLVAQVDADAVRRRQKRRADRWFTVNTDHDGMCAVDGWIHTADARALEASLAGLAATVCPHDPRTPEQRRADAVGALAARAARMGCLCGRTDCTAKAGKPASPYVIHVIAAQDALPGADTAAAGVMIGVADGLITADLLAELAVSAQCVPLIHPGDAAPEPRHIPSKALADFVRCRDLTCRWPGCDVPATRCDVDREDGLSLAVAV